MSNQAYKKKCMYCDQEILMDQINGKWAAYNLNGGFHQCTKRKEPIVVVAQPQTSTGTKKVETNNNRPLSLEELDERLRKVETQLLLFQGENKK